MNDRSEEEPINILLVEDNPIDIKIAKRSLKEGRITNKMYVVRDGQEALDFIRNMGEYEDAAKAPKPDLILLDINLPKLDGIEVLKELKKDPKYKRIPVVMLTMSDDEKDIFNGYDNGANSYITKPVEFDKFLKAIKAINFYWTLCKRSTE